jgi:3-deoxy-D-arabino-heptulosonate 7-phosphate (DAHP) synthase
MVLLATLAAASEAAASNMYGEEYKPTASAYNVAQDGEDCLWMYQHDVVCVGTSCLLLQYC